MEKPRPSAFGKERLAVSHHGRWEGTESREGTEELSGSDPHPHPRGFSPVARCGCVCSEQVESRGLGWRLQLHPTSWGPPLFWGVLGVREAGRGAGSPAWDREKGRELGLRGTGAGRTSGFPARSSSASPGGGAGGLTGAGAGRGGG